MAQKTDVLAELRETSSAEAMYYALIQAEVAVLESQPGTVR
jgi:hypothetical protein